MTTKQPSIAAQIRAWIAEQGRACLASEVHAAFPTHTRNSIAGAIGDMVRAGMLIADSSTYPKRYAVGRGMKLRHFATAEEARAANLAARKASRQRCRAAETPEQRAERLRKQRGYSDKARRKAGNLTRAEYAAKRRKPKPAKAPKPIDRAITIVRRMKADKPKGMPRLLKPKRVVPVLIDAPSVQVVAPRAETYDEWVARTGQTAQRLGDGDVSKHNRLHRIGARA